MSLPTRKLTKYWRQACIFAVVIGSGIAVTSAVSLGAAVPSLPQPIAFLEDRQSQGAILVVMQKNGKQRELATLPSGAILLITDHLSSKLLIKVPSENALYVVDSSTEKKTRIPAPSGYRVTEFADWKKDSSQAIIVLEGERTGPTKQGPVNSQIALLDEKNHKFLALGNPVEGINGISSSPQRNELVLSSEKGPQFFRIVGHTSSSVAAPKGMGALAQVGPTMQVAWSPSGDRLALITAPLGSPAPPAKLIVSDSQKARALDTAMWILDVNWSSDGRNLTYSKREGRGSWQLWLNDLTGKYKRQLSSAGAEAFQPLWSTDAKHILFLNIPRGRQAGKIGIISPDKKTETIWINGKGRITGVIWLK